MPSAISVNSMEKVYSINSGLVRYNEDIIDAIWPSTEFSIPLPLIEDRRNNDLMVEYKKFLSEHNSNHRSDLHELSNNQAGTEPQEVIEIVTSVKMAAQRALWYYEDVQCMVYDRDIIDVRIEPHRVLQLSYEDLEKENPGKKRWEFSSARADIIRRWLEDFRDLQEAIMTRADEVIQVEKARLSSSISS